MRMVGITRTGRSGVLTLAFNLCLVSTVLADLRINEFLASNRFSSFDEDGDSEDWIEIYNSGDESVSLLGYTISDDGTNLDKWAFPDVTVPAGGYLIVWLSGKDRFVPPPEDVISNPGSYAFEAKYIQREAYWKYLVADLGGTGPPLGWNLPESSAPGFLEGHAGFGYGDEDDYTDLPAGTNAVFIRKEFVLTKPQDVTSLILQIDYDDGFVAYLNGTRVAAVNGPAGDPGFSSFATGSHEAGTPERFDLTPHLDRLRFGTNVLGVVGLNVSSGSSDMTLHPELGVIPLILHANFSLERDGEGLLLVDPSGEIVDGLLYPEQTEDHSFGRIEGQGDAWFYLLTPTSGAANETAYFTAPISSEVEFSVPAGKRSAPFSLEIAASPRGLLNVHFTTDGSEPTTGSRRYGLPIYVSQDTVVRAAGFIGDERATRVVSRSYFFDNTVSLPILSISMGPQDYAEVHNTAGGRGRMWERPAFMEYIESDGHLAVATGMGLRLHGGAGRGGDFEIKKSYKVYFRGVYGETKLHYPIIPDTSVDVFDKLVLRAGFNDSFRTNGGANYLRDQLIRDLHQDMGSLVGHGSWCFLYVNMKFRGLFNIVERMDEDFLASYLEGDDWDVIKTGNDPLVGTLDEWVRTRNFIVDNDMADDGLYEQATQMLDMDNFTSYMILNMWAQNHDWPHNNWYAFRRRTPDGKWYFLSWDAEFGIGLIPQGYSSDSFDFTLTRNGYIREMFEGLLANAGYRIYFMRELERHLREALSSSNVLEHIQRLAAVVRPDIENELDLFGRSLADWERNVQAMETFASARGPIFQSLVEQSTRFAMPTVRMPILTSVTPSSVVNVGGIDLVLTGTRITAQTEAFFNGVEAGPITVGLLTRIRVPLPFSAAIQGPVRITLVNPDTGDAADFDGLLYVELPVPTIDQVTPAEAPASGGDTIRILGESFTDGVKVFFGDVESPEVSRVGDSTEELDVVVPPGAGIVPLRVLNTAPADLWSMESVTFSYTGTAFVRGDANLDSRVDLSDAVTILGSLFLGDGELRCELSGDANASQVVDISDAVSILDFLFQGGEAIPAPYPACGFEPVPGPLSCESGPICP